MKVVIKQYWGKFAAVRLPAAVMKSAKLAVGQPVDVRVLDGVITLRPWSRCSPTLEELIAATPSFDRVPGWLDTEDVGGERVAVGR